MDTPTAIHDRDAEWKELTRIWRRASPELVFVLGRRRVGKSFLLTRFARTAVGIYYQATKRTENEQLLRLSTLVGEHFDDPALRHGGPFPDWEGLFRYVAERAAGEPFLFVMDEFPYLSAAAPALPSILQSLWDHEWPDTRMKLVLSGSHIAAMKQLEDADQPLYGRHTARIDIEPFDYVHAAEFVSGYPVADRLRAFGIFGGVPGHLALLDPSEPLGENVAQQMLRPTDRLLDEAQHMLDAFLADAQVHYSVIGAIAGGERTWNGIAKRVGRDGGSLSHAVQWLIEMRIIERVVPVTETNPRKSKRARYRITDPYVAFWHRFVSPMISAGMIGLAPRGAALGGAGPAASGRLHGRCLRIRVSRLRSARRWPSLPAHARGRVVGRRLAEQDRRGGDRGGGAAAGRRVRVGRREWLRSHQAADPCEPPAPGPGGRTISGAPGNLLRGSRRYRG